MRDNGLDEKDNKTKIENRRTLFFLKYAERKQRLFREMYAAGNPATLSEEQAARELGLTKLDKY